MNTILIVDDHEQNRYLLRTMLTASGDEVLEAANGAEALELARRTPPDLIISDILMPQMDGFALCRECKREEQLRDIPFVFYTATYTDPRDEALALQMGAARFIVKPVESEEFIAIISEVLQAQAAGQFTAPSPPFEEETSFYRLYNEALVRKLEEKMLDLEQLNRNLAESEERFRRLAENAQDLIFRYEFVPKRGFTYVSPAATVVTGYTPEEYYADPDLGFKLVHPADRSLLRDATHGETAPGQPPTLRWVRKDGQIIWTEQRNVYINNEAGELIAIEGITRDVTERKQAEEIREGLQAQLVQAQKMESVGRLAGGVAHDFNNMLGIILGHAELALERMDDRLKLQADLKGIQQSAQRSAELTRQLLTFARKQTITPEVLNLNDTVAGIIKMLRRLIGEDIELIWIPGVELWPFRMDPGQVDQLLANLCVNARDAISGVGKIYIKTNNVTFDENYCANHLDFKPGEYVLLSVKDNGCGMEKDILAHVFEPFFTTKEAGSGTGLGLATVYGIVKQNQGFINVDSEPGQGTTFMIYLPRYVGKAMPVQIIDNLAMPVIRGQETVLLVEDEPAMLELIRQLLEELGYRVLATGVPSEAIRLAEEYASEIHLLITDVVMPEMNGRDLTERLLKRYPDIKLLFMSGYTANIITQRGVLDEGIHFIQKPFAMRDLATKVQEVLKAKE